MRYSCTLLSRFFKNVGIKYSQSYLSAKARNGVNKGSLYELSYLLRVYGVDHEAVRIDKLRPFENFFFVKYNEKFVCAHFISEEELSILSDKEENVSLEEFVPHIDNHLLIVEDYRSAGEPNYEKNHRKEMEKHLFMILFILLPFLALCGVVLYNTLSNNTLYVALFSINFAGLLFSAAIVSKRLRLENSYTNVVDKLCRTNEEGSGGCNAVVEKSLSRNHFLSLESLSTTFFSVNFLSMAIGLKSLPFITLMYFCAVPFLVWSIVYQKMKLKTWCRLCLGIDAAILAFVISAIPFVNQLLVNFNFLLLIVGLAAYAIVASVMEFVLQRKEMHDEEIKDYEQLRNEKFSYSEFEKRLNDNPLVIMQDSPLNFIKLSACENPKYDIVIVSNPYCAACAELHKRLSALPHLFFKNICLKIVFHSFRGKENVAKHLTELSKTNNCQEILDKWFDADGIIQNEIMSMKAQKEISTESMEKQFQWIRNNISKTPSIFINGHLMPNGYELLDVLQYTL